MPMFRQACCSLALVSLLVVASARAELCAIDDVPAATLLLPYFEVDWANPAAVQTLFSINNASASAAVAHVTLWTDESIPTLDFDVYLTGYDVQTINLRNIFNGILPRTADDGIDPDTPGPTATAISNQGALSLPDAVGDVNFPGSTGPCGSAATLYAAGLTPTLSASFVTHLRNAHTGRSSAIYGGCVGLNYGDNIARGYVTIDSVTTCNLQFPSSTGYFTGLADNRNILWGDYFYDDGNSFAQGETLVHIEACAPGYVGQPADECPFTPGDYTFYGRYVGGAATDQREPLATNFGVRYINSLGFQSGTDLLVWRDAKIPLGATIPVHSCTDGRFGWVPLNQADVVAFDEAENPQNLCFVGSNVSPPIGGEETCFPVEAQRVNLLNSQVPFGANPAPTASFGWIFLNLNTAVAGQAPGLPAGVAQAWVTAAMAAEGRYAVGFDAIKLDTACDNVGGGVVLIP
jgi:hypothetical protein